MCYPHHQQTTYQCDNATQSPAPLDSTNPHNAPSHVQQPHSWDYARDFSWNGLGGYGGYGGRNPYYGRYGGRRGWRSDYYYVGNARAGSLLPSGRTWSNAGWGSPGGRSICAHAGLASACSHTRRLLMR